MRAPQLEQGRLSCIRSMSSKLNDGVWMADLWTPQLQQENNSFLMEFFASIKKQPGVSGNCATIVSDMRLWLQVITIADLADKDVFNISSEKLDGK